MLIVVNFIGWIIEFALNITMYEDKIAITISKVSDLILHTCNS